MTQTPQPAQTAAGSQSSKFWDDIFSTGIRRDRSRQWFGGVCAGIARRVDVDPVLIRAAVIALTFLGGFGVVVYLVAWLMLPDESGRIMARDAINRDGSADAGGAIALSVIALVVIAAIIFGDNGFLFGWGIIPLAVIGWFVWRHQQRREGVAASPWMPTAQAGPAGSTGPVGPGAYAAGAAPASYAPTASVPAPVTAPVTGSAARPPAAPFPPADPYGSSAGGWQPPPAPPVPPRAHVPLAPPPPPRPRRRSAGFAGFALVLGVAIVGYGVGLMLDGPVGFSGSRELFGGVVALGAASLATMVIGLMGRRSLMSVALVMLLGLGTAGAGIGEQTWEGGQGIRTWTPSLSTTTTRYELGAGETTIDLRPLVAQLAAPAPTPVPTPAPTPSLAPTPGASASPVPTPTTGPAAPVVPAPTIPQQIEIQQGAGEMRIIVPAGANAQIRARSTFGDVQVRGDLPGGVSERDRGNEDGPSETLTVNLGSGSPTLIVRADMTFGQITIQEG